MKQNIDQIKRPIMIFQCDHPACQAEALAYLYPACWTNHGEEWYCPDHRPENSTQTIPGVEMVVLDSYKPLYEYRVTNHMGRDPEQGESKNRQLTNWLNYMGSKRWELVEKTHIGFIFKRIIIQE